jgi:hypothetical protein
MKRTLLLTSAAVALTLGLTPAIAQDHADSKMKRDAAATEQHDRDANRKSQKAMPERGAKEAAPASTGSSRKAANKDEAGSRSTTGQAEPTKAGTKASDKNATDSNSEKPKSANTESKSGEFKRAEDRNQKQSGSAATNKSGTAEPNKNAEQNDARSPAAQKATQSSEPNRNAQTQAPSRNAAETKSGSEPKERAAAKLDPKKKERLTAAIGKVDAKPLSHVDFSVSVGVAVPRTVDLRPVPTTIVDIVPQYRGYDFFVVRDEVVIVAPRTHKIVDVIERRPTHARAEKTTHRVRLSEHQREIIRHHATSRRTVTTGAGPRTTTEVTVGETLPDSVEVESFPEDVYREVPEVREYRYIERGDDVYLVDPSSRRVIEEVR